AAAAAGGGGGGGGGGGEWSAGTEDDASTGSGKKPGGIQAAPVAEESRPIHGRASDWKAIILTGVGLIAVGSALVLLLPRFVAYSRAFFKLGLTRRMPVLADDPFKMGLAQFQKSRFEKALEQFQRVALEPGERAITGAYYSTLCLVKMERKAKALQQLNALPLTTLTVEEVYRLARACEESSYNDTATMLFRHIYQRDASYKDVKQRVTKDAGNSDPGEGTTGPS
ncbi:MAG: hypothetical protein HY303_21070, partial [Candidatus Wallbacteria bacterium]|nr:hypothetical protein [Candidatus Wallbacteria bacterium]